MTSEISLLNIMFPLKIKLLRKQVLGDFHMLPTFLIFFFLKKSCNFHW